MPKVIRGKKWVHRSALSALSTQERAQVQRTAKRVPDFRWTVARVENGATMLGRTTPFTEAHPELLESVTLKAGKLARRTYADPPVYHRIEQMLLPGDPRAKKAHARTTAEAKAGLLNRPDIGRRSSWKRAKQGSRNTDALVDACKATLLVPGMPYERIIAGKRSRRGAKRAYGDALSFAKGQGLTRRSKYWKGLVREAHAILRSHGVELKRQIGVGTFAQVYLPKDTRLRVVKLTGDRTEAVVWSYILQQRREGIGLGEAAVPALAHTYCAFAFPPGSGGKRIYGIVQRRYLRLRTGDQVLLESVDDRITEASNLSRPYATIGRALSMFRWGDHTVFHGEDKIRDYLRTLQELASFSLVPYDMHAENVMASIDRTQWAITDLGVTQAPIVVPIPVLEMKK
jgi:hypothetical protein